MELQNMKVILHTASSDLYSACGDSSRVFQVWKLGAFILTPRSPWRHAHVRKGFLRSLPLGWDSPEAPSLPGRRRRFTAGDGFWRALRQENLTLKPKKLVPAEATGWDTQPEA